MEMTPDIMNGTLELGGGLFLLKNVLQLHRDKVTRGVHWAPTAYFAFWGLWNLYYYPHLEQWFSVSGAAFLVSVNLFWFGQMMYYRRFNESDA